MIAGYVDENALPRIKVRVLGTKAELEIEAIVDTGFNSDLCLPVELAIALGLELAGLSEIEFADGTVREELFFGGKIKWGNSIEEIDISLTRSKDALIGTGLLACSSLHINFPHKEVRIDRQDI